MLTRSSMLKLTLLRRQRRWQPVMFLLITATAHGQLRFQGPGCLITGRVAVYRMLGPSQGPQGVQVCLSPLAASTGPDSCWQLTAVGSSLPLSWSHPGAYRLRLSEAAGSAARTIEVTRPLDGGRIDSSLRVQILKASQIPLTLRCSPATGGQCSPRYFYQWERSPDAHHWKDLPHSPEPDLGFAEPLKETTYFRRKVTETRSGICSYSSIAVVFVDPTAKVQKP